MVAQVTAAVEAQVTAAAAVAPVAAKAAAAGQVIAAAVTKLITHEFVTDAATSGWVAHMAAAAGLELKVLLN